MPITVRFRKHDPAAVLPTKASEWAAGYDVTLVKIEKMYANGVTLYSTGISYELPPGYHFELVARSSISKTNYLLRNGIGILDSDYRGVIMVALERVTTDGEEIVLPCRFAQLLLRKTEQFDAIEVGELSVTARGDGGFGSTNLTATNITATNITATSSSDSAGTSPRDTTDTEEP